MSAYAIENTVAKSSKRGPFHIFMWKEGQNAEKTSLYMWMGPKCVASFSMAIYSKRQNGPHLSS